MGERNTTSGTPFDGGGGRRRSHDGLYSQGTDTSSSPSTLSLLPPFSRRDFVKWNSDDDNSNKNNNSNNGTDLCDTEGRFDTSHYHQAAFRSVNHRHSEHGQDYYNNKDDRYSSSSSSNEKHIRNDYAARKDDDFATIGLTREYSYDTISTVTEGSSSTDSSDDINNNSACRSGSYTGPYSHVEDQYNSSSHQEQRNGEYDCGIGRRCHTMMQPRRQGRDGNFSSHGKILARKEEEDDESYPVQHWDDDDNVGVGKPVPSSRRLVLPNATTSDFRYGPSLDAPDFAVSSHCGSMKSDPREGGKARNTHHDSSRPPHVYVQQSQHPPTTANLSEQERYYSASSTTINRKIIQIAPGLTVPLRSAAESLAAYQRGLYIESVCPWCTCILACLEDADYVLCEVCKAISPLVQKKKKKDQQHTTTPAGSLCFGIRYNSAESLRLEL